MEAGGIDRDAELKKAAGVEKLSRYSNDYELQTICKLFPALTPEAALEGDDTFYTKNLLANLEKNIFELEFQRLKSKQHKK